MNRILIATAAMLWASAAMAHTHLHASVPADKSKVAAPEAIELHFSDAARLTALTLQQGNAAPKSLSVPSKAAKDISVPVKGLGPGAYTVSWRVASEDGHVMSGNFSFTVVAAGAPAATPAAPAHDHAQHQH